jgi:hypothetical protein
LWATAQAHPAYAPILRPSFRYVVSIGGLDGRHLQASRSLIREWGAPRTGGAGRATGLAEAHEFHSERVRNQSQRMRVLRSHEAPVSVPLPPLHRSPPGPPFRRSRPASPNSLSRPGPPNSLSLPEPPQMTSLPPLPRTTSFPPSPWMTSGPGVPMMMSLPSVPRMVAARPLQRFVLGRTGTTGLSGGGAGTGGLVGPGTGGTGSVPGPGG